MQTKKTLTLCAAAALLAIGCQSQTQSKTEVASAESEVCNVDPAAHESKPVPTTQPQVAKFGAEQRLAAADAVPVSAVLATPDAYAGKYVRIRGVVSSVCPAKGCWLRVTPDGSAKSANVFVKFPDPPEGRLVPMAAVGHEVAVEGTVKNATISEASARHFLQDAGANQQELDKIIGPQKQVMVSAPAVSIQGVAQNAE